MPCKEKFEDTTRVIRTKHRRKTTDNIMSKGKQQRTKNDLHNPTQKSNQRATRTSLTPCVNLGTLEQYAVPAPLVTPTVLLLSQTD